VRIREEIDEALTAEGDSVTANASQKRVGESTP